MALGTVKWFSDAKGFGFIQPDDGAGDVFAHFSVIKMEGFRTLRQGARVSFELTEGPKGPLAHDICPIDTGPTAEPAENAGNERPSEQGAAAPQ
jgi:CspA family cold shock protein